MVQHPVSSRPTWNPLEARTPEQRRQLQQYGSLLRAFNRNVNLISREDEAAVEEHHVLHCLALTYRSFPAGVSVVDWGTGGGLPALPLAIAFPEVTVYAVDAVDKKIQAVRAMARRLGVDNLHPWHGRAEAWTGRVPYSVSRATAPLSDLWAWHAAVWEPGTVAVSEDTWRPGLVCLKGGDLSEEIAALRRQEPDVQVRTYDLYKLLGRSYFRDKCILEVFRQEP